MSASARAALLALAGYAIVAAIMLAPITSYRHLDSALFGGDTRLNAWALAWVDHALLDQAAIFDANIFYPTSNALAYSEHLLGIGLIALPVYVLTRNAALSYNIVWLLSYLACAMAAWAVGCRITRDRLASWVGGLVYAFCFYRMLHGHAHLQLLWACWIPLSLLLLERWWRQPSIARLLALWLVVLVQVLTSWYLAILVLLADALFALWLSIWHRPSSEQRTSIIRQLLLAASAGAAIVAPIAQRYTFLVDLADQGRAEALGGSLAWRDLFVPPLNTWTGQWLLRRGSQAPPWIWGEKTLFLGYVAILLGALGLFATWSRSEAGTPRDRTGQQMWLGFMAALSVVALLLALGPSARAVTTRSFDWTPFGLFSAIPGLSLFRVPARFVQLVTLALSTFAAAGAAYLHRRLGRTGRVLTLLLVPLMLSEWYLVDFPGGAPAAERVPSIYRQLARLPLRAVVSLPDYVGGPEWFNEADYQYYATVHWHPIVNGYSRTEPPGYRPRMAAISTFPSRESADTLRRLGVDYVVLHTKRYRQGGENKAQAARSSADFALAAVAGPDYLFQVLPAKP